MKSRIRTTSTFLLFITTISGLYVGVSKADDVMSDTKWAIDTFVKAGMKCHPNNLGMSLSVVHQGKTVLSKGYGFKTVEKQEPVTNETLFGIASLSKSFAATLILKLIDEHKNLSLSTKVKDILNNDHIFEDSLRSKYATLEDLLAHRLGIPSNNNIRLDTSLTRADLVRRLQYLKAVGGFRTSFYYNNLIYGLVTYIAEVIGQKPWEVLVKEKLFDALSMTSSTFVTTADFSKLDIARGYQDDDGKLFPVPVEFSRHWGTLCGSGCVLSNSNDMAKWMNFHLHEGEDENGKVIVKQSTMGEAYRNQNSVQTGYTETYYTRPITPVTWALDNYGLAWKVGHYRGYKVMTHSGTTYGYRALLTLVPSLQIGVYTALTGDDPSYMFRTNIHSYIIDVISGNQPWLNSTSVCTFPEPWKKSKTRSKSSPIKTLQASRDLELYTGSFKNEAYGPSEVYLNDSTGQLMAKIGIGQFVLYPKKEVDEFYAEGVGPIYKIKDFWRFQFKFEDGDNYTSSLVVPSFNSKYPPVFERVDNTPARQTNQDPTNESTSNAVPMVMGLAMVIVSILSLADGV